MRLSRIGGVVVVFICFLFCILFLYKLNPESSIGRFMEWRVSAPMIKDHPIKGVGHGRFAVEYLYYQSRYFENPVHNSLAYKAANVKQAHNEYLQAFCESGILGGLLFLSIWIFALWNLFYHLYQNRNHRRQYYGLAMILLTILIHALVDTPLHVLPISVVAYIALGLIPVKESIIKKINVHSGLSRCMITIVLLLFLIFILGKSIYQYPGYNHWNKGVKYARNHYWEMAIEQYQSALKRLGGEGELQFHLGSAMVLSGSNSRGVYFLKESLKNFNDKNIYLSLGYGFLHLKNYIDAEKYTRIALSMFPDHLAPHLLLGEIYYYQGKIEDSKASLKKCINRQTSVQSDDILQIATDARNLWKRFYAN
ncbi:MAG: O-antigen ligase family protein [Candidatus Marinimicrobia bacterium]|nr:O-antigen ligase family protein [Candidatus Neomarinimicrobiota bacterium]